MNATAYIALGANLGERGTTLASAIHTLTTDHAVTLRTASSLSAVVNSGHPAT